MADGDRDEAEQKAQPSLELPKLGWRRKRRTASTDSPAPPSPSAAPAAADAAPAAAPEPAAAEPATTEPAGEPVAAPAPPREHLAPEPAPPEPEVAREPSPPPAEEPVRRKRVVEPSDGEPTRAVPQPARERSPKADGRVVGRPAGASLAGLSGHPAEHSPEHATETATLTSVDTTPEPDSAPARARRVPRLRRPGGMAAAVLTGVVVGLGIVGLTWAALRLWESVRGTSVAGNTGYPLLVAIVVIMVVVGALLLRAARVPEAGSTSFLGVGLTAVIALLFLVDSLLDRSMVVVIPVITAATFAASHWVTRTFVEPGDRDR